jgi:hypothetical protein
MRHPLKAAMRCFSLALVWLCFVASAGAQEWQEKKGKHFIIYFYPETDVNWIDTTLSQADAYYRKIANQIGYSRYQDYWSWEDRVKIFIYPDKDSFIRATGQPQWSKGGSAANHPQIQSRAIISYDQQQDFVYNVLPHEIAHLTLKDFVQGKPLPVWFEEGVAQLLERDKVRFVQAYMKRQVQRKDFIAINRLNRYDIRLEPDPERVQVFYAQSLSIIDFLIQSYGSLRFGKLCRRLREGTAFEEAITSVYKPEITSLILLEKKWLSYVNGR